MPDYDYRCVDCDKVFSVTKSYTDETKTKCPFCGKERLINIISKNIWVKYKGNGFTKKVKENPWQIYKTDV